MKKDMSMSSIRLRGNRALFKALGPAGFARYMQQFVSRGNYTEDREKWIDGIGLSELESRGAGVLGKRGRTVK